MNTQSTVTRTLVPEDQRLAITEKLFGVHFPLQLEPVIYGITERMADGLRRRLLGVLDAVQRRVLHGTVRRSAPPRHLPEPIRRRPVGRRFGDHVLSVRLQPPVFHRRRHRPGVCTSLSPAASVHGRAPRSRGDPGGDRLRLTTLLPRVHLIGPGERERVSGNVSFQTNSELQEFLI